MAGCTTGTAAQRFLGEDPDTGEATWQYRGNSSEAPIVVAARSQEGLGTCSVFVPGCGEAWFLRNILFLKALKGQPRQDRAAGRCGHRLPPPREHSFLFRAEDDAHSLRRRRPHEPVRRGHAPPRRHHGLHRLQRCPQLGHPELQQHPPRGRRGVSSQRGREGTHQRGGCGRLLRPSPAGSGCSRGISGRARSAAGERRRSVGPEV